MIIWPRRTYLDHNATTPVARQVRRAMAACLKRNHGNPSSLHIAGRVARGAVENARRAVAALLGCQAEDLYFTSGGTEANNAVIKLNLSGAMSAFIAQAAGTTVHLIIDVNGYFE
jgi:cysteine desulfurase